MAGMHGRKRPKTETIVKQEEEEDAAAARVSVDQKPSVALDPSDSQLARTRLHLRWELACVLNFLRVFKPLTLALEISPEQIETALITPNGDLSRLHIALLKGIPPVSKNLSGPDAWVTVLCKKLAPWWPWVAEGDIPLKAAQGEISRYNELDPVTRLLLLKALCEIRAFQDDAISYINDALKQGNEICTFRKDRIGGDGTGVAYWIDGDAVMGYRLYREVTKVEFTPRKGKGRVIPPPTCYQWETLATNLEDFQQISDKLSSSEIVEEAAVANVIKNEIIPVLEGIQKKKEKALKRQQKQVMLLNGYFNTYRFEGTRSCRSRKPVNYTFDEYDKTIDEAIQLNKKRKKAPESKHGQKGMSNQVNSNGDSSNNKDMEHPTVDVYGDGNDEDDGSAEDDDNDNDEKLRGDVGGSDSGDKDYDDQNDETDNDEHDNENNDGGDLENNISGPGTRRTRHSQRNGHSSRDVASLRRSARTGNAWHPDIKARGQGKRDTHATGSDSETSSDSGKESTSESSDETSGGGNESSGVQEGCIEESDGDE